MNFNFNIDITGEDLVSAVAVVVVGWVWIQITRYMMDG